MEKSRTWRWLGPWAWSVSIVLHAVAVRSLLRVPPRGESPPPATIEAPAFSASAGEPLVVQIPVVTEFSISQPAADPVLAPQLARSGDATPKLDTGRGGRGGSDTARELAVNFAPHSDSLLRSPDLLSHLDANQLQRVRSGSVRSSWEDRRATLHPAELTLLVVGNGDILERRPLAANAPSRGARTAPDVPSRAAERGVPLPRVGAESPRSSSDGEAQATPPHGSATHDEARTSFAVGLTRSADGDEHHREAPSANARPAVTMGPVAVVADARDRPADTIDTEQRVATAVASLIHASGAGREVGDGTGGSSGGPSVGMGGTTGGARARPLGFADGDIFDLDTADPRLVPYFRQIHAKLSPLWANAFPRSAMLELKQGRVILEFTLDGEGNAKVSWPPVRPSGIPEFDRNCRSAIERGSPYGRIPQELGVQSLRIRAPFTADNPIIH